MSKGIIKSRTFWVNIFMAVIPLFSNHVGVRIEEFVPQFTAFWGLLNIGLRLITKDKVVLID